MDTANAAKEHFERKRPRLVHGERLQPHHRGPDRQRR